MKFEYDYKILIAQLLLPDDYWTKNAKDIWHSLTYPHVGRALVVSRESSFQGPFAAMANARNRLLDDYHLDRFDKILWVDSDIVSWPHDLIERLLNIEENNPIAPFVYIEPNETWRWKRFYDISCFRTVNDEQFDWRDAPPARNSVKQNRKYEVNSIGTCVLEPMDIYSEHNMRFDPYYHGNEWVRHFEEVRKIGYKVFATDEVCIEHAFLPKYGQKFR